MTITRIETFHVAIPFDTGGAKHGMRPGLRPWDTFAALIVRIETADGLTGWGEAFGHFVNAGTQTILQSLVAPWFLGKDERAIAELMDGALRTFHGFGRNGPVIYALSGIDIALWDIAAKRAGQPLFRLLGGQSGELRLYASLMRYGGDAAAIRANCIKARDAGYRLIKLHENTVPAFMAVREAVPADTDISLDVNCPWSVDEARAVARAIHGKGFHWFEEPVWPPEDFAGLARVREEGVTIAGGENVGSLHEFRRAFEARAFDVVQPSVTKIGGVSAMLRIFALAEAFSVRVVPHCFYWGPGYLATAHLAASLAKPPPVETAFITMELKPHPLFDPMKGSLKLPDAPGLGFEPDWPVLERYLVNRTAVSA